MGQSLVIRADASTQMGTGHLMRCLALAQAWRQRGGNVTLVTHCESQRLRQYVEAAGVTMVILEEPHPAASDVEITLQSLGRRPGSCLVLDGYHFGPGYQESVREAAHRMMIVDDTAHQPRYHADLILNQNINAPQLKYACNPEACLLLGPGYALLRQEFLAWRDWDREIPNVARRVLVTLGGSDPDNVALKVICALQRMNVPDLEARIVVGAANPHLGAVRQAVGKSPNNLDLRTDVADMAGLMAWADVAITAGGSTCWELAFMGVPFLVIVLAENQLYNARALEERKAAVNLGWFEEVDVAAVAGGLQDVMASQEQRAALCRSGRRLVDGLGAERVTGVLSQAASPARGE